MATQREVAEHLFLKDTSGRQVRNWHKQPGFPVPTGKGGYDLAAVRKWYIDFLKSRHLNTEELDPDGGKVDKQAQAKLKLLDEKIKAQQLANELKEGKFIPVDAAREILGKILAKVGATFDALPLKIKRNHPELEKKIIDGIKAEVISVQNEASQLDELIDEILDEFIEESEA